jgi:hypothetical protein
MSYFDLNSAFRSSRYQEMQSYFKNEYRNDHEWAFNNWLESKAEAKKKVFSSIAAIFGALPFLRSNS